MDAGPRPARSAGSAGERLVTSHLQTLFDVAPDLSEDEGAAAVEATFVIAERFMGRPGVVTPLQTEAIYRTLRQRAMRFIDAQLSRGPIETARIAQALGVSRSSLYRAFEATGGVQACILSRRLDRVYVVLRMHRGPLPPLAEIRRPTRPYRRGRLRSGLPGSLWLPSGRRPALGAGRAGSGLAVERPGCL